MKMGKIRENKKEKQCYFKKRLKMRIKVLGKMI